MPDAWVPSLMGTRAPPDFCWLLIIIFFSSALFFDIFHVIIISEMKKLITYNFCFQYNLAAYIIICIDHTRIPLKEITAFAHKKSKNIFRKTLMSLHEKKQAKNIFEPRIYNISSKQEAKLCQFILKPKQRQLLSLSYQPPQPKRLQKKKQVLNKTFNRTKTDFAHNFVGRKYFVQVQEQRKKSSISEVSPFKRNCHRHQNPPNVSIRHHISHQNIGEVAKKIDDKKEKLKQFSNNESKRYQNFLKLKKKCYHKKIQKVEIDKSLEEITKKKEYQLQNTEIAPWESLENNSSWINPY